MEQNYRRSDSVKLRTTMLASLAATLLLGVAVSPLQAKPASPKPVELLNPATFKADFNKAKGAPRVVIILSPS